jgi:hypothetical protein
LITHVKYFQNCTDLTEAVQIQIEDITKLTDVECLNSTFYQRW